VDSAEISCDFIDTVNITSGHLDQHGSFHHNGTVFTKGSFAEFDYVLENFTTKTKVEPHIRGCICEFKPCIRVCCRGAEKSCVETEKLLVPLTKETQKEIDLTSNEYEFLNGKPCKNMFVLEPEEEDQDFWIFSVSFKWLNF
jgi:G protein-coupled receptor Mth (Methuselah protein)